MQLRDYQSRGLEQIDAVLATGARRVLAVAPTGSGKGTMAAAFLARAASRGQRGLFLVHRREIVRDVCRRLKRDHGVRAGAILPGEKADAGAMVQVASVQSLLRRSVDKLPPASVIVPDEAHHYAADEWGGVLSAYPNETVVGFTATPQRADGCAMGDVFERMVVVATYSQLIAAGHIVDCQVLRPPSNLGIDLAQDPVDAYLQYANGTAAMVYERSVARALALTERFERAGVSVRCIHASTGDATRKDALARFADGAVTVIVNVYTMTEGIDVPRASTIVLARACDHASTYVQIVGRALRPHPGKASALLLDLCGASYRHGLPTDEREYSLDGAGMGASVPREQVERVRRIPKTLGLELRAVGAQAAPVSGPDPKRARWDELATKVELGELSVAAAVEQYVKTEGERPAWVSRLSDAAKAAEMKRLQIVNRRLAPLMYQVLFE